MLLLLLSPFCTLRSTSRQWVADPLPFYCAVHAGSQTARNRKSRRECTEFENWPRPPAESRKEHAKSSWASNSLFSTCPLEGPTVTNRALDLDRSSMFCAVWMIGTWRCDTAGASPLPCRCTGSVGHPRFSATRTFDRALQLNNDSVHSPLKRPSTLTLLQSACS